MSKPRVYVGSAVVDGKIRFLSVSQVKLFDPSAEGCNRKWAYQYLLKKRLEKTTSQTGGVDFAEKLEHYLNTGENVLPPVLQEAQKYFPTPGPDLSVEEPLGIDYPEAVRLRDLAIKSGENHEVEIRRLAGLTALGIPFEGAADYRHMRGEYIDEEGQLRRELPGIIVVETGDLKTTSRINPTKIMRGKLAGQTLPGYAKTSAQVCDDIQMLGYARHGIDKYPSATHHRLSHVYAQTTSKGAAKRTGIISVEEVLRRWARVEGIVAKMVDTATATDIKDIEPTVSSCEAYTHVVMGPDGKPLLDGKGNKVQQRGCGHRYYCPLSEALVAVATSAGPTKESTMSLFDQLDPVAMSSIGIHPGIVPTIPPGMINPPPLILDPTHERSVIEEEKARLMAEDRKCSAPGCGVNCTPGWVKTAEGGYIMCKTCGAIPAAPSAPAPPALSAPPAPQSPMAVLPPDVPPPAPLLHAAAPLPAAALAEITDPALRQTIEQHKEQHEAAQAQAKASAGEEKSIWCGESKKIVSLTMEMALERKYICSCTKVIRLKPAKQPDGSYQATLPRHKPVQSEDEEMTIAPAPPAPPAPAPPAPPAPLASSMIAPPAPPASMSEYEEMHPGSRLNGNGNGHHKTFESEDVVTILKSIDERLSEMCSLLTSLTSRRG